MSIRWNGRDLQEDLAFENGLARRLKSGKSRSAEIVFFFALMLRVQKAAKKLSRRDVVLIEAVLRHGNLSGAARNLRPERPEALRSYLSQRLRRFKEIAIELMSE